MKAMLEDPVVHTAALTNQVSRPKDTPMPHRTKPSSPQLPSAVNRRRGQGHRGYLATFQSNISSLKMRHGNHAEVITEKRAPQPQEEGSATGKHGQEPAEKGSQIEGDIPIHECEHSPTRRNPVTSNHFAPVVFATGPPPRRGRVIVEATTLLLLELQTSTKEVAKLLAFVRHFRRSSDGLDLRRTAFCSFLRRRTVSRKIDPKP